jgi:hypothetical protein
MDFRMHVCQQRGKISVAQKNKEGQINRSLYSTYCNHVVVRVLVLKSQNGSGIFSKDSIELLGKL